jgi:hypothetical protein
MVAGIIGFIVPRRPSPGDPPMTGRLVKLTIGVLLLAAIVAAAFYLVPERHTAGPGGIRGKAAKPVARP